MTDMQKPFDVAVVTPTILRPNLTRAIESIYAQDFKGRIQVLIGIDRRDGDMEIINALRRNCPGHIGLTVYDPGYSTAQRNGSLYSAFSGGSMRTVLSYAANSRLLAYLDDDNWWAPHHLSDLRETIRGCAWAFSRRWFVDVKTLEIICEDDFISVGPGKGMFAQRHNGMVDTNCLMMDKMKCHFVLPHWCNAMFADQSGTDRWIFKALLNLPYADTGRPSAYYLLDARTYNVVAGMLRKRGYHASVPGD